MWKSVSALLVWGLSTAAVSQELVLETWRVDDEALWKEQFLPRFQAIHPEITLKLHSQRSADYDRELAERLAAGKAGISSLAALMISPCGCSSRGICWI